MNEFSVKEAAALLGVSDDTVRRWGESGRLTIGRGENGRQTIAGTDLLPLLREPEAASALAEAFPLARVSARNRFTGIVTRVQLDGVMAQVDVQAGPFRVVSLLTREAAEELGLEPGSLVVANAKATTIGLELP